MAYGTMGGDGQPQTQAALFTRHVRFCQPLDVALDAPRWLIGRTWGSAHDNLRWNCASTATCSTGCCRPAMTWPLGEPYAENMGHAGAVVLHPDGMLEGAHDPRADGGAAGV